MKKIVFVFLTLFVMLHANAQENNSVVEDREVALVELDDIKKDTSSSLVYVVSENLVYASDFLNAKERILRFIGEYDIHVIRQEEGKKRMSLNMIMDENMFKVYENILSKIGYTVDKSLSVSSNNEYKEMTHKLSFLLKKKADYEVLLASLDAKTDSYLSLWKEKQKIEKEIFDTEKEILELENKKNAYFVKLRLEEEMTTPEYTGISFVNMPGFEYGYLNIENPQAGISAAHYQGYFIKYLFTRGKSFLSTGVFQNKSIDKSKDDAYAELFMFSFGQDFYSRHLGRGSRKFFNLYSGYSIGGFLATGKNKKLDAFYIAPAVGLELLKTKHILIDTKGSYFIPFKENLNLRGFSLSASINFVF